LVASDGTERRLSGVTPDEGVDAETRDAFPTPIEEDGN
jgi:hypothetical protein